MPQLIVVDFSGCYQSKYYTCETTAVVHLILKVYLQVRTCFICLFFPGKCVIFIIKEYQLTITSPPHPRRADKTEIGAEITLLPLTLPMPHPQRFSGQ